ncbi:MAG: purine-nucleoside phosphorylase [Desulfovibrionaceae bacterium]|nr:purine-nucleoside phosphorylase [Desulfovibrionaceae bacterium]
MSTIKKLTAAKVFLENNIDKNFLAAKPTGLILGTGINEIMRHWAVQKISYLDIPNFPKSQSTDHGDVLALGYLGKLPLIVLTGRAHLYEGYSAAEVCFGVRLLAMLGVKRLIITNSSGALNPNFSVPGLLLVTDQINLTGQSPLIGPNDASMGLRFPDLTQLFDPTLQKLAQEAALSVGIRLERGVYVGVHGPELETPAETRFYRAIGGDAIGMSSVLEAIAAKHMGLDILEISCLSNKNLPDCMQPIKIEDVVSQTQVAAQKFWLVLKELAPKMTKF